MKVGDINCKVWDFSCGDGCNGRLGEIWLLEESLVNFGIIIGEVRGIMIKRNRTEKGGLWSREKETVLRKGRVKGMKKVKVQDKRE